MKILLFFSVFCIIFGASYAQAQPMLPEATPPEKLDKYNKIFQVMSEESHNGMGLDQSVNMLLMMLQLMPADERQQLIMDMAKKVQLASVQERQHGLETVAGVLRSINDAQKTNMYTQITQTLQIMQPVEQQIIGVQLNKLLKDLPGIPMEDRNALSPVMNMIISTTLAPR